MPFWLKLRGKLKGLVSSFPRVATLQLEQMSYSNSPTARNHVGALIQLGDDAGESTPSTMVTYAVWRQQELPAQWQQPVSLEMRQHAAELYGVRTDQIASRVCCELPDLSWARRYRDWHVLHFGDDETCVDIMLTPLAEFRGEASPVTRSRLAAEQLRSIVTTGRPGPMFTRVFHVSGLPVHISDDPSAATLE